MRTKTEPFEVLIPTPDGKEIAERVAIEVIHEWDEDVGEWLLTPESLKKIDDTKARHLGLLLPEEIRALRERLGLTQDQIASLLEIGEKSWSRWENGRHRPSRSVNLLLRALDSGRLDAAFLRDATGRKPQWSVIGQSWGEDRRKAVAGHASGCPHDRYAPNYSADQEASVDELKVLAA
ncbi:MAG: helix-turn-helix domain-containing protein [Lentisphaerae bacterium]|nr:helix-turn-helix domain-containing protein [Lentisphaerota bacterium]